MQQNIVQFNSGGGYGGDRFLSRVVRGPPIVQCAIACGAHQNSRVVSYRTRKCSLRWSFLLIRICIPSRNKFSLVAQAATLGNFFNLHKCKMAADRYRSFLILEPLVPRSSVVPRLRVVWLVDSSFSVGF